MRKYIIIGIVLVAIGIGASFFLLPSPSDTQQAKARDQQTIDLSNIDVEAEYNQGRRSFPIVAALADKRIAEGNRPAAIALLEEFTKAHTTDAQGHQKLAEQYMLAGRQADYNNEILLLGNLAPTEENLHVLSFIYNADKNYPKQAETLQKIIDVTKGEKAQYFVDLANIKLMIGDKEGAMKTLDDLKARQPDYSDFSVLRIRVSILAQQGKVEQAFSEAKQWVEMPRKAIPNPPAAAVPPSAVPNASVGAVPTPASREAEELADLCNIFNYSGYPDKALTLVEPHVSLIDSSTTLAVAYINASINAGKADAAYALLVKIDTAGKMTPDLAVPYLQLALEREDATAATHIAQTVNLPAFSEIQALNLIETARLSRRQEVLSTLLSRANSVEVLKDKPVLSAVIGILGNTKDQDARIQTALNSKLASEQRMRLAESCARGAKKACFDTMVKQYPAMETMTTPQLVEYAQLYIIANRPADILKPFGAIATKRQAHPDVIFAYIRLAAAAGDASITKPWLASNAEKLPIAKLQGLFYLANDHQRSDVAMDVAERIYARDPSPMNRKILAVAYLGASLPEKALPLLRESIQTPGAEDGSYISALTKLAPKDAAARKELTDYAQAALQSGRGDDQAQLNYAFALLNNGKRDEALPFIRSYAESRGGEWKKVYLQLTTKPTAANGKPTKQLTPEEMLAMAKNPRISQANKRSLAFALIAAGHKDEALDLFKQMADGKAPDSQEVKELTYLWGGKLNQQQLAWVHAQAAKSSPYDKQKWADLVNNVSDDRSTLDYVSATPDALYNPNLRKKYFRVLAEQGGAQNFDGSMRSWVAQTTDVAALNDYASAAQAHHFAAAAQNAYQRVLEIDPQNPKALAALSSITFGKGSYSQASQYTDRAIAATANRPSPDADPSVMHFYKAQLLKTQGQTAQAQAEYQAVIQAVKQSGTQATDALSRMYTAQFNVGQSEQAMAGFRGLLEREPENKNLLADYMSSLIEHRYFDEATRVANQFDKTSPYYGRQSALTGASDHVASVERFSDGRELRIGFNAPLEQSPFDAKKLQQLAWVEQAQVGYDSVVISAKPGIVVRYEPTAQDAFMLVPQQVAPQVAPEVEAQRQEDLRLQLIYAQIETQTGQIDKAKQRIAILKQYYPNDPQLLTFESGVESSSGNTRQAVSLLQQAQALAPENEGIGRQLYALEHLPNNNGGSALPQQFVKLDEEYRHYGPHNEFITTLSGSVHASNRNEMGFSIQDNEIHPDGILDPETGLITSKSKSQQNGELFLAHYFDNGVRLQGSLFGDGNTAGAGGYLAFNNPIGRTELLGEYHKPYQDYPDAAYAYANRDRVGLRHFATLSPTNSLGLEASVNNYNIEVADNQVQTGLFRLSLVHQLQAQTATQPYFGIGYGFDGEYRFAAPETRTVGANTYTPFNFRNREVHFLSGIYRDDWTPRTHVTLVGGYAYDRFNDSGPSVEGRVTQDLTDKWELGARGHYAVENTGSNAEAVNLGADLKYKF